VLRLVGRAGSAEAIEARDGVIAAFESWRFKAAAKA